MEKILIFRYGPISETVLSTGFFRELRNALPKAAIDVLADDTSAEILQNSPYVNKIFYIDGKFKNLIAYLSLFKRYDTIFFLKDDFFFSFLAFIVKVKNRIGFNSGKNRFLTCIVPYDEDKHETEFYTDMLKLSGIDADCHKIELWGNRINDLQVEELLKHVSEKKVLINAFSKCKQKNWLNDYWSEIVYYLSNEIHMQIFLAGSKKDRLSCLNIITPIKDKLDIIPIDMCGKLSVCETISLVKKMDLVISVDSATIHIADALGIPAILLHGPTSISRWKPLGDKCMIISRHFSCSPCCGPGAGKKHCKNRVSDCMEYLTPNLIIDVLDDKFKTKHFK